LRPAAYLDRELALAGVIRLLDELEEAARIDERSRKHVRRADGVRGEHRHAQETRERAAKYSKHFPSRSCPLAAGHLTIPSGDDDGLRGVRAGGPRARRQ